MARPIRGVLFDLDDTLYSRTEWFRSWAAWFACARLGIAAEAVEEHVAFLEAADEHGTTGLAMFREVKARYPALAEEDERALLLAFYEDQVTRVELAPDAGVLIDALESAGVPFGVVSNGNDRQQHKLERLGLASRLTCALISELAGIRKPDPAIFLAAAGQLGLAPADILFIGDNPENDVAGAARAGMQTAWLRRALPWPSSLTDVAPDYAVASLVELLAVWR